MLSFMLDFTDIIPAKGSTYSYCLVADRWGGTSVFPCPTDTSQRKVRHDLIVSESRCKLISPEPCWEEDARVWGGRKSAWNSASSSPHTPASSSLVLPDNSYHLTAAGWEWRLSSSLNPTDGGRNEESECRPALLCPFSFFFFFLLDYQFIIKGYSGRAR